MAGISEPSARERDIAAAPAAATPTADRLAFVSAAAQATLALPPRPQALFPVEAAGGDAADARAVSLATVGWPSGVALGNGRLDGDRGTGSPGPVPAVPPAEATSAPMPGSGLASTLVRADTSATVFAAVGLNAQDSTAIVDAPASAPSGLSSGTGSEAVTSRVPEIFGPVRPADRGPVTVNPIEGLKAGIDVERPSAMRPVGRIERTTTVEAVSEPRRQKPVGAASQPAKVSSTAKAGASETPEWWPFGRIDGGR